MQCPRLTHNVRLNANGTVGLCGHMHTYQQFSSYKELQDSEWLRGIKEKFANDEWPRECVRCYETEQVNGTSVRLTALQLNRRYSLFKDDYLIVGGVLDNVCNSACQTCDADHSTKIGSLHSSKYIKINNLNNFWGLPTDRIVHLDISGGEPTFSKNYRNILDNLPPNVKHIRINTNCFKKLETIPELSDRGVKVTVTVSFDGVNRVHEYLRWPIPWNRFLENLNWYKSIELHDLNLWTTISALNINDLENIFSFANEQGINHSYAFLHSPAVLNVQNKNFLTLAAKDKLLVSSNKILNKIGETVAIGEPNDKELLEFISTQDKLRKINFNNFIDHTQ